MGWDRLSTMKPFRSIHLQVLAGVGPPLLSNYSQFVNRPPVGLNQS